MEYNVLENTVYEPLRLALTKGSVFNDEKYNSCHRHPVTDKDIKVLLKLKWIGETKNDRTRTSSEEA